MPVKSVCVDFGFLDSGGKSSGCYSSENFFKNHRSGKNDGVGASECDRIDFGQAPQACTEITTQQARLTPALEAALAFLFVRQHKPLAVGLQPVQTALRRLLLLLLLLLLRFCSQSSDQGQLGLVQWKLSRPAGRGWML